MRPTAFTIELPRLKRRCRELYDSDTPFRPRVQRNRMTYRRKIKHPLKEQDQ